MTEGHDLISQLSLESGDYAHVLLDELHKVFQSIDGGKGYLEVNELLDFQAALAESKIIVLTHS